MTSLKSELTKPESSAHSDAAVFKQHTGLLSPWVDGMRIRRVARSIQPGQSVLDIGCGPGFLLSVLPASCHYAGIDINPALISSNRRRFPGRTFQCLDVTQESLPFKNEEFDVVVMAAFLEHLEINSLLFTEIGRVLKAAGRVVATTPTALGGWVHEILSHIGLLSHDAAEEHKGYLNADKMRRALEGAPLTLTDSIIFQMGFNQVFMLQKKAPHG